ncbi:hypothetical protein ONE63_001639 [Megalurothrips usitatus]|uniref:Uncharacterized protein n=1 Tax=Megalurothrips usitatus TaxID=439358 RepID=A0AAV7XFU7_9NEOP|nr:hypothetical protein ONE63_001639 [Megalurothrips usitatus]
MCSSATAGDVYLMTLALGLRHGLSWAAQVDILKMINALFGRKVVDDTKHTQISSLLQEPKLANDLLTYRFNREKVDEDALEDIYDGSEYRKHCVEGGVLANPNNFSYCFNTDGIQTGVSCSVNKTIWPIFICVNELPLAERQRNVLLAGIYVGRSHPNMNTFLEPFVDQANKLSTEGVTLTNSSGEIVTSKLIPTCAVVDSPARCSMLQMNQYNSVFGCTYCYANTVHTEVGRRFSCSNVGEPRTHESTVNDMLIANEMRDTVRNKQKRRYRGVWRPSVLMGLKYFDLIKGFVPDYLHSLLLGAVKQHMEILLSQRKTEFWENMEEDTGIEHLISLLDSYIKDITPPHLITRLPGSLANRDLWKASQWRSWLLFYAIVCMKGELKEKYLKHFGMLAVAANILLQKSISQSDLQFAEILLIKYCYLCEEYFGTGSMNYSIHLQLHIAQGVRSFGGLWTHNTFLYEGQNRYLLQLMSSPRKLSVQLSNKYMAYFSLSKLCKTLSSNENTVDFITVPMVVYLGGTVNLLFLQLR